MVKVIKLEQQYIEEHTDAVMDLFMISYSDVDYFQYGDIIMDSAKMNMIPEVIMWSINNKLPLLTKSELLKEVDRMVYRKDKVEDNHAYKFLIGLWREIKINEIIER